MLVKVISDYSIRYKGKVYIKGKVLNMAKDVAQDLIKRGLVEEVKEDQVQDSQKDEIKNPEAREENQDKESQTGD